MAKKRERDDRSEQRRSRKEILRQRKYNEQTRQLRIGVGIVVGLLALLFVVAIVNEFIIAPNRPVAVVRGEEIALNEWQDRVRFERAQRIILLENQLEAFGGDVGVVQQFAGQVIVDLQDAENLGQTVLNQMVDEVIVQQAAEARGITVTEEDIDRRIGQSYNYYGGDSPTPVPSPTATVEPTPSITPIPTEVITDVLPTNTPFPTPTQGPTATPRPTATPVSEEAFQEEYDTFLAQLQEMGVSEEMFRSVVEAQLYRERLTDVLVEEEGLATEAEHASFYTLTFETEAEANEALALIEAEGYLPVWNQIRSQRAAQDAESTAVASETLWRSRNAVESSAGPEVADAAFSLPLNAPSDLIAQELDEETTRYYIIMVSGREVRPLSQAELDQNRQQFVTNFIANLQTGEVEFTNYEQGRVPTSPVLDPVFLQPPTPAPTQPAAPTPQPLPTEPAAGDDSGE